MTDLLLVALVKGAEYLECDPFLLGEGEEGTRRYAVVQAVLHKLPNDESRLVGDLKGMEMLYRQRRQRRNFLAYDNTLEGQTVNGIGQVPLDRLQFVCMGLQRQTGIVLDKHFDHNQTFIRLRSGHFEEPGAAQAGKDGKGRSWWCLDYDDTGPETRKPYLDSYCRSDSSSPVK